MSGPLRRNPDVIVLLLDDLQRFVGDDPTRTGYETPLDLADHLTFIRVRPVPGSPTDKLNAYHSIDIDCFGLDYTTTSGLAVHVHSYLCSRRSPIPLVDRFVGDLPVELPWDPTGHIRRWGGNVTAVTRRRIPLPAP